jgi:hypothetical protein
MHMPLCYLSHRYYPLLLGYSPLVGCTRPQQQQQQQKMPKTRAAEQIRLRVLQQVLLLNPERPGALLLNPSALLLLLLQWAQRRSVE